MVRSGEPWDRPLGPVPLLYPRRFRVSQLASRSWHGGSVVHRGRKTEPVVTAGIVIGLGIGALFDGIVLHETLQWQHLISSRVSPDTLAGLQTNLRFDGYFLAVASLITIAGIALLWRAGACADVARSLRSFVGAVLIGWGLFHILDEVIDHLLLGNHHIKGGPDYLAFDLGFTALGLVLASIGGYLVCTGQRNLGTSTVATDQPGDRAA